jgi:hypothetical protein
MRIISVTVQSTAEVGLQQREPSPQRFKALRNRKQLDQQTYVSGGKKDIKSEWPYGSSRRESHLEVSED